MLGAGGMSVAYGREVGVIFVIYIMALAYAACSPLILPFALCYFITAWVRSGLPGSLASAPLPLLAFACSLASARSSHAPLPLFAFARSLCLCSVLHAR